MKSEETLFQAAWTAMLTRVRDRHVRFVEHDITRPWPARAGADIVVGNLVLEHIADLRPIFTEARRVPKPGGPMFRCELDPYLDTRWDPDRPG